MNQEPEVRTAVAGSRFPNNASLKTNKNQRWAYYVHCLYILSALANFNIKALIMKRFIYFHRFVSNECLIEF